MKGIPNGEDGLFRTWHFGSSSVLLRSILLCSILLRSILLRSILRSSILPQTPGPATERKIRKGIVGTNGDWEQQTELWHRAKAQKSDPVPHGLGQRSEQTKIVWFASGRGHDEGWRPPGERRWGGKSEGRSADEAASTAEEQMEDARSAHALVDKTSKQWAFSNAASLKSTASHARERLSGDGGATSWFDTREPYHLGARFSRKVMVILGRLVLAPLEIRAVTFHYGALFLRLCCLPGLPSIFLKCFLCSFVLCVCVFFVVFCILRIFIF